MFDNSTRPEINNLIGHFLLHKLEIKFSNTKGRLYCDTAFK